jgi:hypothetical protein
MASEVNKSEHEAQASVDPYTYSRCVLFNMSTQREQVLRSGYAMPHGSPKRS